MRRIAPLIATLLLLWSQSILLSSIHSPSSESQSSHTLNLKSSTNPSFALPGCPEDLNAASIEITHPGSGSVPADQHLQLNAEVKDGSGQTIGVFPNWGVTNGSISSQGLFSPHATGQVTVWACIGDVNQSTTLTVLQGGTIAAELQLSSYIISADDVVQLLPMKIDSKGNRAPAFTPTDNYTIPAGSNISSGGVLNWIPGPVGNHTISANILGYEVSVVITVGHGVPVDIIINTAMLTINADQTVNLSLSVLDMRGNSQPIIGVWNSENNSSLPLVETLIGAQIEGNEVGTWRIHANYSSAETGGETWSDYIDITVVAGSLTATIIDGFIISRGGQGSDLGQLNGTFQLTTDDQLVLSPRLEDADGNPVDGGGLSWKLEADHLSFPESSTNNSFTFIPDRIGNHIITLTPDGGVPERLTLEVGHGVALELEVYSGSSENLVVAVGQNLSFEVLGVDGDGNKFPLDVEWFIPEHTGNISNGTQGVGNYVFTTAQDTPIRLHTLTAQTPLGQHDIIIEVRLGQLHHLMIEFSPAIGVQGDELRVLVTGRDTNGNEVPISGDEVNLTSSAGPVRYHEGYHYIELQEEGAQHQITAEYDDLPPEIVFVDIKPTIFGGLLGSSETVIIGGISILSVLLLAVAMAVYRLAGKRRKSDEELIAEMKSASSETLPDEVSEGGDTPEPSMPAPMPVLMPSGDIPPPAPTSLFQGLAHNLAPSPPMPPGLAIPPGLSLPVQPLPLPPPLAAPLTQPRAIPQGILLAGKSPERIEPFSQTIDEQTTPIDLAESLSTLSPAVAVEEPNEELTDVPTEEPTDVPTEEIDNEPTDAYAIAGEPTEVDVDVADYVLKDVVREVVREVDYELPELPDLPDPFPAPLLEEDLGWGEDDPFGEWGSGVANSRALGLIDTYNGPMIPSTGTLLVPESTTERGQAGWYRMPDGTRVLWEPTSAKDTKAEHRSDT
ncbi:MAG TPA: hypothetical protein EYO42_00410 [Candidatus Poseidoniales archaeon]|nr:hypothetical protein [Candidatus Poseidoniales archaeon]